MNARKARKAYDRLPAREKKRFSRRYAKARVRSPGRIIAILVLLALLFFFLAPYFFG